MDGHEVFDDHIDQLQLPDNGAVLFFKLFPLLDHELLDVVVGFIGQFELIVDFGQLLPTVLYLLFES
jgi:hypothetical protein